MNQKIKKYFTFPSFLLAIITVFNFKSILGSVTGFGNYAFLSAIANLAISVVPVVMLVFFVLDRIGKKEKDKKLTAILGIVWGVASFYSGYMGVRNMILSAEMFDDLNIYNLLIELPFYKTVMLFLTGIIVILMSVMLLKDKKSLALFTVLVGLALITAFMLGILTSFMTPGKLVSVALDIMLVLAVFYIPKLFFAPEKAEITGDKNKILSGALAVMVVLYFVAGGAGSTSSGSSSSKAGVCKSCGRSYSAGDSAGNFKSIARSGMCNNCKGNYDSLKWVLD